VAASSRPQPRVLVLALDGATFDLIEPWVEQGKLPNLGRLLAGGARCRLRSTDPPITPCAWTSFSTARDPGQHGIYDFRQIVPGTYDFVPTNGSMRRVRTLWEYLNEQGVTVGLYNLPWMYPPPDLAGYCICGFDAPDINRKAVHPPELSDELHAQIPEISLAADFLKMRNGQYDLEALRRQVEVNIRAARLLLAEHPVDVCVLTFMLLDQVAHFFLHPDQGKRGYADIPDVVLAVHQWFDEGLGELLAMLPDDATIIGVSDHGVAPTTLKVNIDRALADAGLLSFTAGAGTTRQVGASGGGRKSASPLRRVASRLLPSGLWLRLRQARMRARSRRQLSAIDWARTKAFGWGNFAQVRLNVQGREPQGVVPADQQDAVIAEVKRVLLDLQHPQTGDPLFQDALTPEELYSGPHTEGAADVLGIPADDGLDASIHLAEPDAPLILDHATAMAHSPDMGAKVAGHSMYGIFFAAGPGLRAGHVFDGPGICDAGATLLYALALDLPQDLDGRPILEAFEPDHVAERPPRYSEASLGPQEPAAAEAYTDSEAEQVEERLKDLGYM
jgi:predicted AlkP superfamily phosphohydrolase/phosphomutase